MLCADWRAALAEGPFDLVFVDAAPAKREAPREVVEALRPGGIAVLDDLTPAELWPDEWKGRPMRCATSGSAKGIFALWSSGSPVCGP